jgi:hypothetical protein
MGWGTIRCSSPSISVGEGSTDKLLSGRAGFRFPTQGKIHLVFSIGFSYGSHFSVFFIKPTIIQFFTPTIQGAKTLVRWAKIVKKMCGGEKNTEG